MNGSGCQPLISGFVREPPAGRLRAAAGPEAAGGAEYNCREDAQSEAAAVMGGHNMPVKKREPKATGGNGLDQAIADLLKETDEQRLVVGPLVKNCAA
jgi:hypothetical protein